jgi:hypothetical protein
MLGDLYRSGFDITEDHSHSDAIIVNTCAFIEDAKSESLDTILEAAELQAESQGKKLFVTGCLAQRYSHDLAEQLPEVDAFLGFERYKDLPAALREALGMPKGVAMEGTGESEGGEGRKARSRVQVGEATVPFRPEWDRFQLTLPHTAYLRVAEGCNHACSFCAIPGFRGKFRSKSWSSVVHEARTLVERGVKELILIAEDTNQYGMDRCAVIGSISTIDSIFGMYDVENSPNNEKLDLPPSMSGSRALLSPCVAVQRTPASIVWRDADCMDMHRTSAFRQPKVDRCMLLLMQPRHGHPAGAPGNALRLPHAAVPQTHENGLLWHALARLGRILLHVASLASIFTSGAASQRAALHAPRSTCALLWMSQVGPAGSILL